MNIEGNAAVLKEALTEMPQECRTRISFMTLDIEESSFLAACRKIYEDRGLTGQAKMTISAADSIEALDRGNWAMAVK